VPITFHDADEVAQLGLAAFFHRAPLLPARDERFGALLIINARGEPLEFAYNRVELMAPALWRDIDREDAALRRLAISLFEAVTLTPALLLCRADVVGPHVFGSRGGLRLAIPVARLAPADRLIGYHADEAAREIETVDEQGEVLPVRVYWTPEEPAGGGAALFDRLVESGLALEPFTRAQAGLREVYGDLWADHA
jgi:hypothetical protein